MKQEIHLRVAALRSRMSDMGIDALIVPTTDPHASEYTPDHWKQRQWLTGFDGSAGTAVVTLREAALWTDSRYFLQAGEQLTDTPFALMKDGMADTPSITQWLASVLSDGNVVGVDATVNTIADCRQWENELKYKHIDLKLCDDPFNGLWGSRPSLPQHPIEIHPLKYAGRSVGEKLQGARRAMAEANADALLVTQLDEVAWLTNLRGDDVQCTPVFLSFLLVRQDEARLYVNAPSPLLQEYCKRENLALCSYTEFYNELRNSDIRRLMLDPSVSNAAIGEALPTGCVMVEKTSPIALMKAVKNEQEIAGFRQAMLYDGVAMVRFLRWLQSAVKEGGMTELGASRKLRNLREEQPTFRDLSFDTISAYGAHAAIVHYEPTEATDIELKTSGFLLLDSGGQYECGTTDITRTIPLGTLTEQERRDYTLVLKGHIRLALARFPQGTTGTQLDVLARYAMWQEGINYGHGTGHGVGSRLSVHEGPHQIRMQWRPTPLQEGMTVTNEPGIYRAGSHGIRIENTMLVTHHSTTDFGTFLQLEALTLCPIDLQPVLLDLLSADEVTYLNAYHRHVFEQLHPLLADEDEREWLRQATAEIIK